MIKVGVITISDKGSRGEREDLSVEEIKKLIPRLSGQISAYTIGQEATLMLLDYIKKRRKQKKVKILDSKLIKGESCRCVRQAKVNMNLASG